tara:strand:+ start:4 stop:276 length:273 start_codon:yes stop_codon:yes gene_type:complete
MNDKIIECKICSNEMKKYESNNPQPLLPNFEDRVCIDCNYFVTAGRMVIPAEIHIHNIQGLSEIICNMMRIASSLKRINEDLMERMLNDR